LAHKGHLCQRLAPLQLLKYLFVQRTQTLWIHSVQYGSHLGIAGDVPDTQHAPQILRFGPPLVKREQRRVFQGEQGKIGHQRSTQLNINSYYTGVKSGKRMSPAKRKPRADQIFMSCLRKVER